MLNYFTIFNRCVKRTNKQNVKKTNNKKEKNISENYKEKKKKKLIEQLFFFFLKIKQKKSFTPYNKRHQVKTINHRRGVCQVVHQSQYDLLLMIINFKLRCFCTLFYWLLLKEIYLL